MTPADPTNRLHNQLWTARTPITTQEREAFGLALLQHRTVAAAEPGRPVDGPLGFPAQAALDRTAVRRALVERGYLTFTRRSFTPPLHAQLSPKIP